MKNIALEWIVSVGGFELHPDDVFVSSGAQWVTKWSAFSSRRERRCTKIKSSSGWAAAAHFGGCSIRFQVDQRIKRTGLRRYGLRDWEHDEYTGVADEIAQEIQSGRGRPGHPRPPRALRVVDIRSLRGVGSLLSMRWVPDFERAANGDIRLLTGVRQKRYYPADRAGPQLCLHAIRLGPETPRDRCSAGRVRLSRSQKRLLQSLVSNR